MEPEKAMTLKDAAHYCGMSGPVFRDWWELGVIKSIPVRPGSPRRKILRSQLDEFLAFLQTDEANKVKRKETS